MARHCEALTHMCSTWEELARMEHAEATLLHRVRFAIPQVSGVGFKSRPTCARLAVLRLITTPPILPLQRLAAIDKELDEARAHLGGAADGSAAMQRNELDDAAGERCLHAFHTLLHLSTASAALSPPSPPPPPPPF